MDPLAAYVLFGVLFVCIRPIFTNLCPLFPSWNGIVPNINRALKSANLASNDIGDEGAIAISTALESNTTLTDLNLQAREYGLDIPRISATGAQAIAKMLAVNRSLNSVDLRENRIPGTGKQQLRDAVKGKNITLQL